MLHHGLMLHLKTLLWHLSGQTTCFQIVFLSNLTFFRVKQKGKLPCHLLGRRCTWCCHSETVWESGTRQGAGQDPSPGSWLPSEVGEGTPYLGPLWSWCKGATYQLKRKTERRTRQVAESTFHISYNNQVISSYLKKNVYFHWSSISTLTTR